jgi:hypothetical protein
MAGWDWLTQYPYTRRFILRVLLKTAILFVAVNVIFALLQPLPTLGKLSIYNLVVSGRERLPYGENPAESYNLSLNSLDAMFNSHEIGGKTANDYIVLTIGDSSTWGFLLKPEDTLAGQLNRLNLETAGGRRVRAYNLGYPTMSLTKDLMLLDYAMRYEPDMVIWLLTLESFPRDEQIREIPLVENNPDAVRELITRYDLDLNPDAAQFVDYEFMDQTLVGRRRDVADWLRLQFYGLMWETTGIDQAYPNYEPRSSNFEEDITWKSLEQPQPLDDYLAFDVLAAGVQQVGDVPILLVNEPMFISEGVNSDLRYNAFYPRWAYDKYRELMADLAEQQGWYYLDIWDTIPPDEFTDSPVHMTPDGTAQLAEIVGQAIIENARPSE